MPIKAQVIEHSISPAGKELITLQLQYPAIIHAEVKTHRVLSPDTGDEELVPGPKHAFMDDRDLSRNASSSRAIPVKKLLEQVKNDPFIPHHWGANEPGMQARQEINPEKRAEAIHEWQRAARHAAYFAEQLYGLGVHKQIANRLLQPFQWMHVIVSGTEWENFFELRRHEAAEPHFQLLANAMWEAIEASEPLPRQADMLDAFNWHLPYINAAERQIFAEMLGGQAGAMLAKISAARCARVSYLTHDGRQPDVEEDMKLFHRLAGSRPIHASPLEHQAFPANSVEERHGNFIGWVQFRQLHEAIKSKEEASV